MPGKKVRHCRFTGTWPADIDNGHGVNVVGEEQRGGRGKAQIDGRPETGKVLLNDCWDGGDIGNRVGEANGVWRRGGWLIHTRYRSSISKTTSPSGPRTSFEGNVWAKTFRASSS